MSAMNLSSAICDLLWRQPRRHEGGHNGRQLLGTRRRPIDYDSCQFSKAFLVKPAQQEGRTSAVQALPTIGFAKQALLPRAEYD
jgi:hypothetical protein